MLGSMDYTSFSFGPVIFFLICAISSVAWLTLAMSIGIKGIALVPEKKSTFFRLFYVAAIFAAIFFFAVIKYEWLGGDTSYDGLYHSVGFFGSIIIGLVAVTIRDSNALRSFSVGLLPFIVPIAFLSFISIFAMGGHSDSGTINYTSYVIGFFYASIQFIYPLAYYFYLKNPSNLQAAINKRHSKMTAVVIPIQPVSAPQMQTVVTPQPQAEFSNATQDTTNGQ